MSISSNIFRTFSSSEKKKRPFIVWILSIILLYFAFEASTFLIYRYFNFLILWLLVINLAIAISLYSLKKYAIYFSIAKITASLLLLCYDYMFSYQKLYTESYFIWLLSEPKAMMSFLDSVLRHAFAIFLLIYSIQLNKNGILK